MHLTLEGLGDLALDLLHQRGIRMRLVQQVHQMAEYAQTNIGPREDGADFLDRRVVVQHHAIVIRQHVGCDGDFMHDHVAASAVLVRSAAVTA